MEDNQIIKLYQERSEIAISETANKYGMYCHSIAYRILHNEEDSEECVNDTYLGHGIVYHHKIRMYSRFFLGKSHGI